MNLLRRSPQVRVVIPELVEEILEDCALGRLSKNKVPAAFEHLMASEECYERYDAELTFKLDFRHAMALATAVKPARELMWLPKRVWAAAAATVVIAMFVPVQRHGSGPVQDLELHAVRGGNDATVGRAENAVRLHLVTAGVDVARPVMVQIADESGREVWRGAARKTDRNWQVQSDRTFSTGLYWVRVFDPKRPEPPLREYSFVVR